LGAGVAGQAAEFRLEVAAVIVLPAEAAAMLHVGPASAVGHLRGLLSKGYVSPVGSPLRIGRPSRAHTSRNRSLAVAASLLTMGPIWS
jgi:hypothetical protein